MWSEQLELGEVPVGRRPLSPSRVMEQLQKPKSGGKGKDKSPKSSGAEAGSSQFGGLEDNISQEIYSAISRMERTLFVVDLSKLEAEGDTLVGALVVYQPQHELKKVLYVIMELEFGVTMTFS